jgi:hypothetical protein
MPFSSPGSYVSKANTGYATTFAIGSPPVAVLEVKTLNIDLISMPEVDKTHLLSPNNTREFAPGMIHPGKISLGGNYIGDSTQLAIVTDAQAQTTFTYTIVSPMQANAKTLTVTGLGYFSGHKIGPFENDKTIDFTGDVQMSGPANFVVA